MFYAIHEVKEKLLEVHSDEGETLLFMFLYMHLKIQRWTSTYLFCVMMWTILREQNIMVKAKVYRSKNLRIRISLWIDYGA